MPDDEWKGGLGVRPLSPQETVAYRRVERYIEAHNFAQERRTPGPLMEGLAAFAVSVLVVALTVFLVRLPQTPTAKLPHSSAVPATALASPTPRPSAFAQAPVPRIGAAMAYDRANGTVVLFGGSEFGGDSNDTWVWDGRSWQPQHPATSPAPRDGAALAYDASNHGLLLFGGAGSGAPLGLFQDTWLWNGKDWRELHPGTSPPARAAGAMATDPVDSSILLFGGENGGGMTQSYLGDTWAWTGQTWRQFAGSGPSARELSGLTFDSQRRGMVLFGGGVYPASHTDTWLWSNSRWTELAVRSPQVQQAAIATAPNGVVLFGGVDLQSRELSDRTWLLDSAGWHQVATPTSPPARWDPALAYDESADVDVMFGGAGITAPKSSPLRSDTWLFDSKAWTSAGGI